MPVSARIAQICALILATSVAGFAAAGEICISCTGPDATYRCTSEGFQGAGASDTRLQLLCITQLAKAGRHESCAADRRNLYSCEGELRVLAPDAPPAASTEARAAAPSEQGLPPPDQGTTTITKSAPAEAQPATVEEMARKAAEKSGENLDKAGKAVTDTAKAAGSQIEKAGDAVGSAAKKTWDCVTSLFKEC